MSGSGTKKDAFANEGTAANESNQLFGNASSLYGTLAPQLVNQSINPQGYSPTDQAAQTTAAMQSAGGTAAGAAGQGRLYEMRTKNAGAAGNAIAAGSQQAGQQLGQAAVSQQVRNANLKTQQQEHAQGELGSLYGTELGGAGNMLGLSNQALQIAGNQKPGFWQQQGQNIGNDAITAAMMGVTS